MGSPGVGPAPSVSYCAQCGSKLFTGDKFCPKCGASIAPDCPTEARSDRTASPRPMRLQSSGRSESTVVSVSPDLENECIREREIFAWGLQNRQEVIGHLKPAEVPDNLGAAIWRGAKEGATGKKVFEYDHYTKLHFSRPVDLPNLPRIKELEKEHFNLPFPANPGSQFWPIVFTLMPIPGGLMMLADPLGKQGSPGLLGLPVVAGWILLGLYWIRKRRKKRTEAEVTRAASQKRSEEIRQEAMALLGL
jgi:zinc-ribbon domain